MNSTISNSDSRTAPQADLHESWARWIRIYLTATLATTLALWGLLILLDPFSTGRLTFIRRIHVATTHLLLGHAARVRDPRFNAAIIGNSHALPLDPRRIGGATRLRFTQLGAAGLYPIEMYVLANAFQRHHPNVDAFVVMLDEMFCDIQPREIREPADFPAFLFEGSDLDYARQLLFPAAFEAAFWRAGILLGFAGEPGRPDGFDPINFLPRTWAARQTRIAGYQRPTGAPSAGGPPPAMALLQSFLAGLPPNAAVVLFFTPIPVTTLPAPGSAAMRWLDQCKSGYRDIANRRPRTVLVDRMLEDGFSSNLSNFEDSIHVRNQVAPVLEADIVAALRALSNRPSAPPAALIAK